MFSIATAMHSRCNIIHDVGYMEFGTTSSLELLVLCDELVGMSRHFTEGVPVNEESLALDVIDRVAKGSGASSIFLTEDHTFDHFRRAHFLQDLIDRRRFDQWDDDGAKDMYQRCNQRAKELLASHHVKAKSPGLVQDMEDVLDITPPPHGGLKMIVLYGIRGRSALISCAIRLEKILDITNGYACDFFKPSRIKI